MTGGPGLSARGGGVAGDAWAFGLAGGWARGAPLRSKSGEAGRWVGRGASLAAWEQAGACGPGVRAGRSGRGELGRAGGSGPSERGVSWARERKGRMGCCWAGVGPREGRGRPGLRWVWGFAGFGFSFSYSSPF